MAKSNKGDVVDAIQTYKLIESFVKLGSAAKEDAKRKGTYVPPGAHIYAAFVSPNPNIWQKILKVEIILIPIVLFIGLLIEFS